MARERSRTSRGSRAGAARADPELIRQLTRAEAATEPVEAVFMLKQRGGRVPTPERVEELAETLVRRAERQTRSAVDDVNVFRNLGSFVVRAEPRIIRVLLEQPEIGSAVANRQPP